MMNQSITGMKLLPSELSILPSETIATVLLLKVRSSTLEGWSLISIHTSPTPGEYASERISLLMDLLRGLISKRSLERIFLSSSMLIRLSDSLLTPQKSCLNFYMKMLKMKYLSLKNL